MFDVSLSAAFLAGLLSFLSPCILPMVPFYLTYMAGENIGLGEQRSASSTRFAWRGLISGLAFSLGIITIFVALGASSTVLGQWLREYFGILRWVAGGLLVAMGLHFMGWVQIPLFNLQISMQSDRGTNWGPVRAYVIGLAFGFGWTPCVGPILTAILFTAAAQESAANGALLLFVYGAGMTLPFVIASVFNAPFLWFAARFKKHLGIVEKVVGVTLILFGVLIATNSVAYIAQWMLEIFPGFADLG